MSGSRKVPEKWSPSKFLNPFSLGTFYYDGKKYDCSDSYIQMLLYIFMYGMNTSKNICYLFSIYDPYYGKIIELPWRRLSKTITRLVPTDGVIVRDPYTEMLQGIYDSAVEDNMVLDYRDKETFFDATSNTWDSWIKTWILKKYPKIFQQLQAAYPDIKVFL